ncbi:hypothetical protein PX52LOC_07596 [Limnoglobus roseus]|uniref:Uncharacterized protein n=1 Tax=Limnoglobus roseus TaxID=2598579 RepID=A0A5C1ATG0_9BACT|nr:hypothetical protein PX52LOC_07596 [Limnoglobus roseus]
MRYTSFAVVVLGALIACYAGSQFLTAGPLGQSEGPPAWRLGLGLAFGAALVFAGAMMWLFGGKGYTSGGRGVRPGPDSAPKGG